MHVTITGASGLIGSALAEHLRREGHTISRLVRSAPATAADRQWDPAADQLDPAALAGVDAVVHLAGAGIGDHRWTAAYRRTVLSSRVRSTDLLARTLAGMADGPKILLSGSAIGFYGNRGDEELDETSAAGTGFLAEVCTQWEAATSPAEAAGIRVAHLRTGIVLSRKGGALKKLLPLFKLGLGGRFGNGRQWQSWISIDDEVAAIGHLLGADLAGAVNLTAPNPVTNRDFTRILAEVLHRPGALPVPKFAPALLLGRDLADHLLFQGQRVLPRALRESGFAFHHATLDAALENLLKT